MIPLAELKPNPKNVRLHSAKQLSEYKRSVSKFGQTKAIVCDENKTILIGNGLYEAMKELGMTEAACFIKSGMSETDKLKMMMADNKVYSLGVDNLETIEEIIGQLGAVQDFDIPGYDPDLLETLTFTPIDADDFMGGYGILNEDTKAGMEKAAERYAQAEAEFAASAEELPVAAGNPPMSSGDLPVVARGTPEETPGRAPTPPAHIDAGLPEKAEGTAGNVLQRRFLVCPKCGEKIWL